MGNDFKEDCSIHRRIFKCTDAVVKPKYNTDCEMWSVILPCREGYKYTIGDKFILRGAQGEFVFLNLKPVKWNWSPTSLVEIYCESGRYFIKPGEGNLVMKNGVILDTTARRLLCFGAELGFAKYRNDISGGLAMFTFEKREYATNWDQSRIMRQNSGGSGLENSAGLNFNPGQNQVIFSHILSFLSMGNLLNARLVCKQWGDQVTPIVRKKSIINFASWMITPSLRFTRYVHEMKNVAPWPNWQIHCPYSVPAQGNDEKGQATKYFADLNWFLNPRWEHHVKTLSLSGNIHSNPDYGVYIKIVTLFKDTLEELSVSLHMQIFHDDEHQEIYSSKGDLVFKNLRKLSIYINTNDDPRTLPLTRAFSTPWMKTWAGAVKRVDSLDVSGLALLGSKFVEELLKVGAY
ncbi:uncharacterized protein LOC110854473 [Folsomia candida]|uniref:uncharacterized protein LOC110854473 n=1 Tax=Folsomia candida TaxID=158441 RepID=UPI001604B203|nr:uncharacterized protein LOC110854473 [Folsomia candida]